MKKSAALLLALALALGGPAALSEGEQADGQTRVYVPGTGEIVVPGMPEIEVPDVPGEKKTKAPEIEIPDVPKLDIPRVETGLGLTDPMPTATPAPTAAPAGPTEAPRLVFVDPEAEAALDALGSDAYRRTYEALLAGETIRQGTKGDAARGLQLALVALGQRISADGNVGPKTLAALNAVQAALGLEQTRELGAEGFAALLKALAEKNE